MLCVTYDDTHSIYIKQKDWFMSLGYLTLCICTYVCVYVTQSHSFLITLQIFQELSANCCLLKSTPKQQQQQQQYFIILCSFPFRYGKLFAQKIFVCLLQLLLLVCSCWIVSLECCRGPKKSVCEQCASFFVAAGTPEGRSNAFDRHRILSLSFSVSIPSYFLILIEKKKKKQHIFFATSVVSYPQ